MLTPAQQATVKADILADSMLNAFPNNSDGAFEIAKLYNLPAAVDFWVWRTAVDRNEFTNSTSVDGTTFTWVGNGFITRSVGEQTAWSELFNSTHSVNPSLPNVRQAFADIFSGSGNAAANRTHMLAIARRKTTRLEKLLATGTGSTASPGLLTFEGTVSFNDIELARNS
jgi:hypothetical protein